MTIVVFIAIALVLTGVSLILWACLNPKWQHADSFEALGPFITGVVFLVADVLLVVITLFFRWIGWQA